MSDGRTEAIPIGRLLSRASRLLNSRVIEEFSDYDIGTGQLFSLLVLYEEEGICQRDICDVYNLTRSAVGRALNKLEEKNFIERKIDPDDGRKKRVYLKERGYSFRTECMERLKNIESDLRDVLTDEEEKMFGKIVQKM